MTTQRLCDEHGGLCQTLGRIEGKMDELAKSNREQWEKINSLLAKDNFRNGQAAKAHDLGARWGAIISTIVAIAALLVTIWRG